MHNNHKRSKYLKISKSIKEFMFEKICFFNTKKKNKNAYTANT